ncbi:putative interaptin [Apostichopus japonicus]|uniref:Putative interaptin n=1 Tax=Stichopus japonicus TaxID=307972 RepID=A0A2G8LJ18_STIJA|nr:putative interaptin [Apostichopus japonicus]
MRNSNSYDLSQKKLEQIEDLNLEIKERDEEIERLNKAAFDQELSIKQMEQSKEKSYAKLKGAHEESELNIQKLQSKVQNLQLLLEDTKADLQKQHRIQVEELKQAHEEEITDLTTELQKKIDHLESEALNQERGWASDSEEEGEIISSPHSSSRQTQSRKSVRDQLSRQSTRVSQEKSVKPSPPDTPKRGRKVHEVPYEGKVTLEDEDKWTGIPPETLPSAFKQYRKEALLVVHGLQNQLKVQEDDHHKKVKQLREHMKDKDDGFQKEKSSLLKQVDVAMLLKEAAEKEADDALAQLESFVTEHGQLADVAETEKKELKKLTPQQREKFLEKKVTKKTKDEKERKNEYENEGESPDKNDQSKESINNEEKSPIKEVTHDAKDNVDNPDDEQLAEAYEAALNLDKEAKECVDRGQQTSRPESEAVRADLIKG